MSHQEAVKGFDRLCRRVANGEVSAKIEKPVEGSSTSLDSPLGNRGAFLFQRSIKHVDTMK
jgi:hypothetical protein